MLLIFSVNTHGLFLWKIKNGITITNVFQQSLDESNRKPKQTIGIYRQWILQQINDTWLQGKNIEMCSIRNKGKSVVAERFIWNLKTKIYKYMSSFSKNVYIDKLDEIVNKYNNTYHRIIKMKPADVKPSTYILTLAKEKVRKVLNLKLVIISKYHNIKKFFAKGYFLNWSEEVFWDWKS